MSPLTKALVLLVTILSIILVALVIPFVAQTDDLNAQIQTLKTEASVANAAAVSAEGEKTALQEQLSKSDDQISSDLRNLRSENEKLTQTVTTLEAQAKESNSQATKLGTTISLMTATQDQLTNILQNRNEALAEAQSSNVDLQKQNAQLAQANNDLDAQVTGLTRTVRLQIEKITDLQGQLAGGGASPDSIGDGPTGGGGEIRGSITGIQSVDDITLIQLNVGANDAVSPNTKFVIFRNGDQFVGTATIKSVDETVSVAKVDSSKDTIRVGDNAMTGIRY